MQRVAPSDRAAGQQAGPPGTAGGSQFADPRAILRRHAIRPRKSLGQHFLVDQSAIQRIVAAAELRNADIVLEIGAGLGILTRALATLARQVVAVEIDARLVAVMANELAHCSNIQVQQADILALDPAAACGLSPEPAGRRNGFKVVGNLPYYITSAVLKHVLGGPVRPEAAVLTVQAEVGERLLAGPPRMSLLAVSVQLYAQPSQVMRLPPAAFYPSPEVDSVVLHLAVHDKTPVPLPPEGEAGFFRVVRAGFSQRRKQLRNSLAAGLGLSTARAQAVLDAADIDARRRAETLTLQEWSRLALLLSQER